MDFQTIRTVDLSEISNPSAADSIATEISASLSESGFMYVSNHGISDSIISRLQQMQRDFFNLSVAQKEQIAINSSNRGYLGHGQARMHGAEKHDQKEVFFWGAELAHNHPHRLANIPLCGPNQWPDTPDGFKQSVLDYAAAIAKLGNQLLRALAIALDIPADFFSRHYQSPMTRGQLIHYPPTTGGENDFGVAPHTDFGCITLLLQETAGLEVLNKADEWVPAAPLPGTLVINIGDLLERWTNGRLPSTRHRVRNLTGQERYSIAMFHDPDPTAIVDPADLYNNSDSNCYSDNANFRPIAASEYIHGRNRGAFAHFGEIDKAT